MAGGLPRSPLNDASIMALRCFVAVVQTRSFSSAARQLRLAPSSVTKHVKTLEAALGSALVHRTTRLVSVTDAGESFYERCVTILNEIDSAAALIASERQLSGHLRVVAPPSFAASILGPNLHVFLREHPAMSVDVIVTSATPNLIRDRVDVAIALDSDPKSKLAHMMLAQCSRVLCASPSYIADRGNPRSPEELQLHDCIASRFSDLAEDWVLRWRGGWEAMNIRSRLLSDNGDLLRQACLRGAGIGNFYRFHVDGDLDAGRLVQILPGFEVKPKNIYAVLPHRQIIRPQAKAFVEFVRKLSAAG
ncbi:MAG: LysR family transcriptional regulator [Rhizobiaceae bacterium]|nr:LysR family transcriptional regulator [Rhizobiaceae bacterium]